MLSDTVRSRPFVFWIGALTIFLQAYRVPIKPIAPGLDESFPYVLNLFAFTPAKFGSDIVYTYGPFGFLLVVQDIAANLPIGYIFWTMIYAAFAAGTAYFVVGLTSGWRLAVSSVLAFVVASFVDADRVLTCLVLLLLFIGYEEPRYRTAILACCGGVAAIGLLMKVTIGVGCASMILASSIAPFTSLRAVLQRAAIAVGAILGFFCLGWFISCGSLGGIGAYFYNSFQLSAGYTAAMSLSRVDEGTSLVFFLVSIALTLAAAALLPRKRNLHSFLVVLPSVALAWKHGVVRYDMHVTGLVVVLLFSASCLLVLHMRDAHPRQPVLGLGAAIAVAFFANLAIVTADFAGGPIPLFSHLFMASPFSGAQPIAKLMKLPTYRENLEKYATAALSSHRLDESIVRRIGKSTVDVYSYELGLMAANPGLNYRPKPIFQHFNAFTEQLDQLNADFFASPAGPAYLITAPPNNGLMLGVDGRHPLYDDPIAFLRIMTSYRPVFVEDDPSKPPVALLERSDDAKPRFGPPVIFKTDMVRWNDEVQLPEASESTVLRIKVDLQKPLSSKIKEALFRLSPIYLVYMLADGTERRYRLMPTHVSSGVWIAPLFEDYWGLYKFLGGDAWAGPKVVAIRFEADNPEDYTDPFAVSWERIDCKTPAPCRQLQARILARSADGLSRGPVLMSEALQAETTTPTASISAVDVRLSTYAKINKGVVAVEVIDMKGETLGRSTMDASLVRDNAYQIFTFNPPITLEDKRVRLCLSYAPQQNGQIAAWRTSGMAADFDFRIYGN